MTKTTPEPPVPWWCFHVFCVGIRRCDTIWRGTVHRWCLGTALQLCRWVACGDEGWTRRRETQLRLHISRPFDLSTSLVSVSPISFLFSNLLNISWWIYFDYFWLGWKSIWTQALIWLGGSEAIGAGGFADLKCPNKTLKQLEVQR